MAEQPISAVTGNHVLLAGVCTFAGVILYDGKVHLGTFCEDGTYTLPVNHKLHLYYNVLTIIAYAVPSVVNLWFTFKLTASAHTIGVINLCQNEQKYDSKYQQYWPNYYPHVYNYNKDINLVFHWYHTYRLTGSHCKLHSPVKDRIDIETLCLEENLCAAAAATLSCANLRGRHCCPESEGCSMAAAAAAHTVTIEVVTYSSSKFHIKHSVILLKPGYKSILIFMCYTCQRSYTVLTATPPTRFGGCRALEPLFLNSLAINKPKIMIQEFANSDIYTMASNWVFFTLRNLLLSTFKL